MGKILKIAILSFYAYLLFGTKMEFGTWAGIGIVMFYLWNYVDWL
jgi:hypothetical protein